MTEKTIVVPSLVLTYSGVFSLKAIEDTVRQYMSKTHYTLADVSHDMVTREKNKDQTITFFYTHHPHTQEECRMRVIVSAQNVVPHIKRCSVGVSQLLEGELRVTMRATTYSNADEHKQHKKISYPLWILFKKFVYDSGTDEIGIEMKKYCYDIYDQIYGLVNVGKHPEGVNA